MLKVVPSIIKTSIHPFCQVSPPGEGIMVCDESADSAKHGRNDEGGEKDASEEPFASIRPFIIVTVRVGTALSCTATTAEK